MEFTIKTIIPGSAESIYNAWMNSEKHSLMTGGEANISNITGAGFDTWDGYIEGVNIELEPNKRILQSWRTSEFGDDEEDSLVEILLKEANGQTELTLTHSNLPDHGEQYRTGWDNHYFEPMKEYFSKISNRN